MFYSHQNVNLALFLVEFSGGLGSLNSVGNENLCPFIDLHLCFGDPQHCVNSSLQ